MNRQLPLSLKLPDYASFENYHPAGNAEVLTVLQRRTGDVKLVYLHGPAQAGKTHLLLATLRTAHLPARQSSYLPLAELADPVAALASLANETLICLDDIDCLAGKPAAERALVGCYERASSACLLLFSAVAPPGRAGFMLPDLVSRLGGGVSYGLRPLDDEGKRAALRLRARCRGLQLTAEVIDYVMRRYPRDNRNLFALLDQLDSESLAAGRRITVPFLRQLERRGGSVEAAGDAP